MSEEKDIEEILIEASAHNLRTEVMDLASTKLKENPKMRKVDAYQKAYLTLTK
jgi:hypothetical protein|tara:strand:+ start:268 stop:426 length:159 start_codon:yes stop_codon:yes gene_type:complete